MDNVPTQTAGTSELLASDWNTYVRDNFDSIKFGHVVVADATARTALGNVAEGVMVYQSDNNKVYVNSNGTTANWVEVSDLDNTGAVSDTVQNYLDQYAVKSRNMIINGAMQISQRSAVGSAVTFILDSGFYTADRFQHVFSSVNSLGSWTDTTIAEAPTGSGFRNSFKVECTTADASPAAGDYMLVRQRLEGQDLQRIRKGTSSAQPLVLTFWVRSNVTGTYVVELEDLDNTRSISKSYTVNASATWQKVELSFGADTTGALDNDNAASMSLNFWLGAGTTYTSGTLATSWGTQTSANRAVGQVNLASATSQYWQITGVQLEVGSVSTPFEFLPFGDELARCQRYYYRITATSASQEVGVGYNTSTSVGTYIIPFPTSMRVAPSSIETNGSAPDFRIRYLATTAALSSGPSFASSTTENIRITANRTGLTAGQGSIFIVDNSTPGTYFAVSAEL